MDMRVAPWKRRSAKELMLSNCDAREDSERLLDCKEFKPVNPKEINPKYSLEGLMLKLQYFGHLMQRTNSLEKTLWDAGIRKRHSFYFLHLFYPFVNILASYSNLFS